LLKPIENFRPEGFEPITSLLARAIFLQNKEGNDVEVYVPSEVQEDQLFEQGINCGINFDKFYRIPV
jgi:hypothetical protein